MTLNTARAALLCLAAAVLASGCASLNTLTAEVSSFGAWPAERKPASYAFERLPSQQARASETEALEAAARAALARAGFVPAAAGQPPDVLVQVGSRLGRADAPWSDPFWWRGGWSVWRPHPWLAPRWTGSVHLDLNARYERELALLIRDRASGQPLFEAYARHESSATRASGNTLTALFDAALADFPRTGVNPRPVTVTIPAAAAASANAR